MTKSGLEKIIYTGRKKTNTTANIMGEIVVKYLKGTETIRVGGDSFVGGLLDRTAMKVGLCPNSESCLKTFKKASLWR